MLKDGIKIVAIAVLLCIPFAGAIDKALNWQENDNAIINTGTGQFREIELENGIIVKIDEGYFKETGISSITTNASEVIKNQIYRQIEENEESIKSNILQNKIGKENILNELKKELEKIKEVS